MDFIKIRKTAKYWNERIKPKVYIIDPDRWDREHYEYSFYKEKITKKEYKKRLSKSTIMIY